MAREAGQAVTSFRVRRQFVDGNIVCSIIDWEMAIPGLGTLTVQKSLPAERDQVELAHSRAAGRVLASAQIDHCLRLHEIPGCLDCARPATGRSPNDRSKGSADLRGVRAGFTHIYV